MPDCETIHFRAGHAAVREMAVAGRDDVAALMGKSAKATIRVTSRCKPFASDILNGCEHPGMEVIQQMAVQRPVSRIVGVERDQYSTARCHDYGVAHGTRKLLVVDRHDLKFMTVKVHRVWHRRLVDKEKLDTLAPCNGKRRGIVGPG